MQSNANTDLPQVNTFISDWYIIPSRIRRLPGMTLAYLDVFETIFQFLNKGKNCFLSNRVIAERVGYTVRCVQKALAFFAKHNELKRIKIGSKHYFIVPEKQIYIGDDEDEIMTSHQTIANENTRGGEQPFMGGANSRSPINKEVLNKEDLKDHDRKKAKKERAKPPTIRSRIEKLGREERLLYDQVRGFKGINPIVAIQILEKHTMGAIRNVIEMAIRDKVTNPGGYLVKSLYEPLAQSA